MILLCPNGVFLLSFHAQAQAVTLTVAQAFKVALDLWENAQEGESDLYFSEYFQKKSIHNLCGLCIPRCAVFVPDCQDLLLLFADVNVHFFFLCLQIRARRPDLVVLVLPVTDRQKPPKRSVSQQVGSSASKTPTCLTLN